MEQELNTALLYSLCSVCAVELVKSALVFQRSLSLSLSQLFSSLQFALCCMKVTRHSASHSLLCHQLSPTSQIQVSIYSFHKYLLGTRPDRRNCDYLFPLTSMTAFSYFSLLCPLFVRLPSWLPPLPVPTH